ncbi:hypothetical protein ABHF33_10075 [Chitinibacter sp. FCG-7]|uniref:Uncharacterized protein n=1 Tax=Chitinibacter mangrovi TaxID=3153927 RepID=A0AAU7F748_9NEIS
MYKKHVIDFFKIQDDLLILFSLASAKEKLVVAVNNSKYHDGNINQLSMDYRFWLEDKVSRLLIDIATHTRIAQDIIYDCDEAMSGQNSSFKRSTLSISSCELRPASLVGINPEHKDPIREICNKIIHALSFELEYVDFWSGKISLRGIQRGSAWQVEVDVNELCLRLRKYIELLHQQFVYTMQFYEV